VGYEANPQNLRLLQQSLDFSRKRGHDEERAGVAFDGADGLFGDG